MKNIAIIPARSGSKGLKDKNIKKLNGKPLMAYSIEAARESNLYDCIHVSTDSELYADIAIQYGAEVPFLRTNETASDTASTMQSNLSWRNIGNKGRNLMQLPCCSPPRLCVLRRILEKHMKYLFRKGLTV